MIPYLSDADIQSVVAYFDSPDENLELLFLERGARLCYLPQQGLIARVRALRRLIRTEQPDVVHTTLFEADVIGRFASMGQPTTVVSSLVTTSYDPVLLQNSDISRVKLWLVRLIDAWTARYLTTHFHAISVPVKEAAIRSLGLPSQRITVIERGRSAGDLPSAKRRADARRRLRLDDSDDVIVTVGRQEFPKGQRYLVEAMYEVLRRRPQAHLIIAGRNGRQTPILEEIRRRKGLVQRVHFLGYRQDVPDLLACADLFVFPSLYEGLGGAVLEAMAWGLPIVASRIPAIEDVVEEGRNALLVERASVAPLADAMTTLLADREKASRFGRRSREIFEKRFTLDRYAARMVEFYRGLKRCPDPLLVPELKSDARCG
jgi:glycosyltransferase involved in cell wall biosynthesis